MATIGLREFADHLKNVTPGEFRAEPFYEPTTDALIYYFQNKPSYSKRINKFLTLFLSDAEDALVGIEVTGLKIIAKAIEDLGPVPVKDDGHEVDLSVLVRCSLVPPAEEGLDGQRFDDLNAVTRGVKIPPSLYAPA